MPEAAIIDSCGKYIENENEYILPFQSQQHKDLIIQIRNHIVNLVNYKVSKIVPAYKICNKISSFNFGVNNGFVVSTDEEAMCCCIAPGADQEVDCGCVHTFK